MQKQLLETMALSFTSAAPTTWEKRLPPPRFAPSFLDFTPEMKFAEKSKRGGKIRACFEPFEDQPIIKDAIKEPVAFMGGVFAGLLRLDLSEDPLKEWLARTVEASGIAVEGEINGEEDSKEEAEGDSPQQIEIE
ncbi:UPF0426 protein At1g28150, chloroplastic-like [Ananas comosus]|uniref:UPF0426 protein At1g28150, chloroplastic-like n=1 Tax=Ananas comosus TaxID=4615 RepID=A0A6P5ECY1_ANACO|nr:UPF0426 protein At1g28150, chloroplastic-like [Ananas comosus]